MERLNMANYNDNFFPGQEINQYAPLSILQNSSHNFFSQGYSFDLPLLRRCSMMQVHALPWVKMVEPAFITS
jgi:hypothetical protein